MYREMLHLFYFMGNEQQIDVFKTAHQIFLIDITTINIMQSTFLFIGKKNGYIIFIIR